MFLIVFIPLLIIAICITLFSFNYTYRVREHKKIDRAINLCEDIEHEVSIIKSNAEIFKSLINANPQISKFEFSKLIIKSIYNNKYVKEFGFDTAFNGWGEGVLSYDLSDDLTLRFKLNIEEEFISITHYDGSVFMSRILVPEGFKSYTYRSEVLKWEFVVYYNRSYIFTWWVLASLILIIILGIVVSGLFISNIDKHLKGTLNSLLNISRDIGLGNYKFQLPNIELTEFYHIAESFCIMAEQVRSREDELHQYKGVLEERVSDRTRELSETVETLKHTQNILVESEKMVSLGLLVSGISHEINTPLGIIITGVSYNQELLKQLQEDFNNKKISTTGLLNYIESSQNTGELVLSNSVKVSNLIKNFKMVAKDQESDDIREFEVADYLQLIITNIEQKFSNKKIDVDLVYDEEVILHTYPGALFKVISNLIKNSFEFGYGEDINGVIKIYLSQTDNNINIVYTDDGCGMDEEVLTKIFEPFFTTNRTEGSIGLGMFIAYNQITQTLKGSIISECIPNSGTKFTLSFPKNIEPEV